MPDPREDRKFYIRAPSLEYRLGGPIRLGHVLKDAFAPQDPIYTLNPVPKCIEGVPFGSSTVRREGQDSLNLKLTARIYEAFSAHANASTGSSQKTVYTFDHVQPRYFETNPNAADAKALIKESLEVKAALKNGPVYIVTGVNVAKNLKYSTRTTSDTKGSGSVNARVSDNVKGEAKLGGSSAAKDVMSYNVLGDVILAYRLHIIKRVGWVWKRDEIATHDPGKAGFMDIREADGEEDAVVSGEFLRADLDGFVDENEYDDMIREVDFVDDSGDVTLVCVDT